MHEGRIGTSDVVLCGGGAPREETAYGLLLEMYARLGITLIVSSGRTNAETAGKLEPQIQTAHEAGVNVWLATGGRLRAVYRMPYFETAVFKTEAEAALLLETQPKDAATYSIANLVYPSRLALDDGGVSLRTQQHLDAHFGVLKQETRIAGYHRAYRLCGEKIEDYRGYKERWLKRFIPLANGIPSHDTIRRSGHAATRNSALHMVGGWAAGDSMVLGQVRTEDHSNEITAIPKPSM